MADNLLNAGAGRGLIGGANGQAATWAGGAGGGRGGQGGSMGESALYSGGAGGGRGGQGGSTGEEPTWAGGAGGGRGSQGVPAFGEREVPGVPDGAEPEELPQPEIIHLDVDGVDRTVLNSLRVMIRVPSKYLTQLTSGSRYKELSVANFGGIIFPYTPTISYEVKAEYAEQKPLHSNFSVNFYQRSTIGSISIGGKFSVENGDDADVYLSTLHLLKALTRMRSGGAGTGDMDSGAPPPVCRLDAYGSLMLKNVPVVITSFRVELPDSVDYYTFNNQSVPTLSNLQVTCLPMYSRQEMQNFSVTKYLNGSLLSEGYI